MKYRTLPVFCLVLSLFFAAPALADFQKGLAAYDAGDYALAFEEWSRAAENNDVAAMRNLGHLYRKGMGVEANPARAAYWYHRAAEIGFDRAQFNLALLYFNGEGVPRDEVEGLKWLTRAAKKGHVDARGMLAEIRERNGDADLKEKMGDAYYELFAADKKPEKEKMERTPEVTEELQIASAQPVAKPQPALVEQPAAKPEPVKKAPMEPVKAEPMPAPVKAAPVKKAEPAPVPVKKAEPVKVVEPAPTPVKSTKKPKTELLAHLGSYRMIENANKGWDELVAKHPVIGKYKRYTKDVLVKGKTYHRLYAVGEDAAIKSMCITLMKKDVYCVVYDASGKRIH